MDDTLSIKDLDVSTLDSANFPGTARSFARTQSSVFGEHLRSSQHISSLSPSVIRIAHRLPKKGAAAKRYFLSSFEQTLTRLDANSNPIGFDDFSFKISGEIPKGVSEAEFLAAAYTHLGGLLANNGANLKSLYRGEF